MAKKVKSPFLNTQNPHKYQRRSKANISEWPLSPREACPSLNSPVDSKGQWYCKPLCCVCCLSLPKPPGSYFSLHFLTLSFSQAKHPKKNTQHNYTYAMRCMKWPTASTTLSSWCLWPLSSLMCRHSTCPFLLFTSSLHLSISLPSISISHLFPNLFLFYKSVPLPSHRFITSLSCIHIIRHLLTSILIWSFFLSLSFSFSLRLSITAPIFLSPLSLLSTAAVFLNPLSRQNNRNKEEWAPEALGGDVDRRASTSIKRLLPTERERGTETQRRRWRGGALLPIWWGAERKEAGL